MVVVAGAAASDASWGDAGDAGPSSRSDGEADDAAPPATRRADGGCRPSASLLVVSDATASPPPRASHPTAKRHQRRPLDLFRASLVGRCANVRHAGQTDELLEVFRDELRAVVGDLARPGCGRSSSPPCDQRLLHAAAKIEDVLRLDRRRAGGDGWVGVDHGRQRQRGARLIEERSQLRKVHSPDQCHARCDRRIGPAHRAGSREHVHCIDRAG